MLFGKKTCEGCGANYDATFDKCPKCNTLDAKFLHRGVPRSIAKLYLWQQILLFLVGFAYVGLTLAQLLMVFFVKMSNPSDNLLANFIVMVGAYLIVFALLICIILPRRKEFFSHFKDWTAYLYGIAFALTLLAFSNLCGAFSQFVLKAETNVNQGLVEQYFASYPFVSFIIMGIVGPLCEEITYRAGLYSAARRLNKYVAFIVTIIVFALIHFDFDFETTADFINECKNLPSYLVAGFILCLAYEKKGPACSMVAHVLYNSIALLISII